MTTNRAAIRRAHEDRAVRPGYPTGAKTTRDCALSAGSKIGRSRARVTATVAVVSGRASENVRRTPTPKHGPARRLARQGNGKQGLNYGRKAKI